MMLIQLNRSIKGFSFCCPTKHLLNSDLPGYNQEQQQLLGALVYQHRKRLKPDEIPELRLADKTTSLRLIRLLRLAILFSITRKPFDTSQLRVVVDGEAITLQFATEYLEQNLLMEADLYREQRYWEDVGFSLLVEMS